MDRKLPYIQWLRCFAALAVVLMHLCSGPWYGAEVAGGDWLALTALDGLVRWPVPVFVMISGALFLGRERPMGKYIRRSLTALIFWSGVYTLVSGKQAMAAWTEFLCGHYHLWYLYFLCGLYLIAPFLGPIARDDRLSRRFLILGLIFGNTLPRIPELLALFSGPLGNLAATFYGRVKINFLLAYVFQFVLGYRLSIWEPDRRQRWTVYGLGLLGAAVTVVGTAVLSRRFGSPVQVLFDPQSPHITAVAAALFVFAKANLKSLPRWADSLARHSFGVYLAHVLFIEELAEGGITVLSRNPLLMAPVLTAAITGACWLLSALVRRIPGLGKHIV